MTFPFGVFLITGAIVGWLVKRLARALASSLELDQAFGAFSRELRGLLSFARVALVLVEAAALR